MSYLKRKKLHNGNRFNKSTSDAQLLQLNTSSGLRTVVNYQRVEGEQRIKQDTVHTSSRISTPISKFYPHIFPTTVSFPAACPTIAGGSSAE